MLSAVSVLVVAQSSSEIPEGLMNNPVYLLLTSSSGLVNYFLSVQTNPSTRLRSVFIAFLPPVSWDTSEGEKYLKHISA